MQLAPAFLAASVVVLGSTFLSLLAHAQLPYSPDTCRQGYVWRDAFSGDHVCVTSDIREQAAHDNSQAAARREPSGGAYGQDTCRQGYVWREARSDDHVCVTPETRAQVASDNSQAAERRASAQMPQAPPLPSSEDPAPKPPSFWTTLPGMLTALGGFITAIAALVTAIRGRH